MPNSTVDPKHSKHKKTATDSAQLAATHRVKEHEPNRQQEADQLSQIVETSTEADLAASREIESVLGKEARLSHEEPEIGPDLEDHGVKSPNKEASAVITRGTTVDLPLTEEEYEEAQKTKVLAHTDKQDNVFGVASVIALALWVGRALKMAHSHAKKLVFRKDGE